MPKQVNIDTQPKRRELPETLEGWVGGKEPQVRTTIDIPRSLHRRMKSALGARGVSVRDFLLEYLEQSFPAGK